MLVQRLSFLPLRWAASLLGLRSIPCSIVLSHRTSLQLGSFKVFPQALDRLDVYVLSKTNAKVLLLFYMCKKKAKKMQEKCIFLKNDTFIIKKSAVLSALLQI